MSTGRSLIEKVWESHVVNGVDHQLDLLYIDLHLIHEASSPQAFDGLRLAGRRVRRADLTLAVEDHNVPTHSVIITDLMSKQQVETLRRNCEQYTIELFRWGDSRQGIVHVVAPERGLIHPGMTVICGTATPPPMARSVH